MSFLNTRRRFLVGAAKASSILFAAQVSPVASALQHPQPMPSPNAPSNQNVPAGMNQYPAGTSQRPSGSSYNGTELNQMVQRLYQMTLDLKQEADRTNLQNILPADFLNKAQQIEKLARQIHNYARS